MTSRRQFLTGLAGFIAAPTIVRAASLMPMLSPKPRWRLITRIICEPDDLFYPGPLVAPLSIGDLVTYSQIKAPTLWRVTDQTSADVHIPTPGITSRRC